MSNALKNVNKKVTAQTERSRTDEIKNNAGGYVFQVSDKSRLERFLILGTDGGTYYANEKKITGESVKFLTDLIHADEDLVRNTIVEVSTNGRAYKNSPALFALALLFTEGKNKAATRSIFDNIARTSTHVFEFAQYIENLGGWGRAKKGAIADWYTNKSENDLSYQAIKYRQRDGWTHRDLFRLSHPVGINQEIGNFVLGKAHESNNETIKGFESLQKAGSVKDVLSILNTNKNLPWEAIPTQFLTDADVWKTLFYNGQLNGQALIRNIVRLARNGALNDINFAKDYAAKLTDLEMIKRTKLHPINYLNTVVTYEEGQVDRKGYGGFHGYARNKDWTTSSVIIDALNDGYILSFKAVESAGKRTFIGVDVSGSMSSSALGIDLSCAQVSGAMAMTIARTEPAHTIMGFTSAGYNRYETGMTDLGISSRTSLSSAMEKVRLSNFGATDCSLPMLYAAKNNIEVDTFVIITDNETYDGKVKPFQALKEYRNKTGINAKLAVLGVSSTGFTIADPEDQGMMDFVGFDSNAPKILADFSAGRI